MSENNEPVETPSETTNPEATTPKDESPGSLLTGTKPEGDSTEASKDGDGEEGSNTPEEPAIPETYEFNIPEGMQLDDARSQKATELFHEWKFSQEQADAAITFWSEEKARELAQQHDALADQRKQWQEQVKADPELGGDKFAASIQLANETLTRFGATPEFIQFLDEWGLANHPEMVKFVVNVGKATAEDRPGTTSGAPAAASMTEGERAYQYASKPAGRSR